MYYQRTINVLILLSALKKVQLTRTNKDNINNKQFTVIYKWFGWVVTTDV